MPDNRRGETHIGANYGAVHTGSGDQVVTFDGGRMRSSSTQHRGTGQQIDVTDDGVVVDGVTVEDDS
jgi:hypothetical protein